MKFSTREDIDAPIDEVFAQVSDFGWFERAAMRRGADVVRTDELTETTVGMTWHVDFEFRGRGRKADIELTKYDPPNAQTLVMRAAGLEVEAEIELVALSKNRTRMLVGMDATPRTIPARLMIQSAKLAKANLQKRYRRRIGEYAADVEERCKA